MKYLMMVCAAFVLLATGCGEEVVVVREAAVQAKPVAEVVQVDKAALTSTLAANDLTLIDFTATW